VNESSRPAQRPLVITAICVIGFINATQMINLIMSPMSKQVGAFYPFYFSVSVLISLACIAGLWFLKRSAALVYSVLLVCNQLVLLNMGYWEISAAIIPICIIGLLLKYWDQMQ
jgi:hypothetical protein